MVARVGQMAEEAKVVEELVVMLEVTRAVARTVGAG